MKIIIDNAIPFIKDRFPEDIETIYLPGNNFSPEIVKTADVLVIRTRTICNESLLKDSNVKLVVSATIGTDHIDIPWCETNGITVSNAPGCNAPGVAQYVLTSLFKSGFDPATQTLGIIGLGNVGSIVADWARKIGIKVLISDEPKKDAGFNDENYLPFEKVLQEADALTLHVPLARTGKYPTLHMIGEKELQTLKPGCILVNSSRGGVVNEMALLPLLESQRLKAIIDVWENEPVLDRQLVDQAFIATPHIAGYSKEGKKRATFMALKKLKDVLNINVNLEGLDCSPDPSLNITKELIEDSYNPLIDSKKLKAAPSEFENLRNNYNYRHEPLFSL